MARIDERLLDVNAHGVLRVPASLWLALLFLARYCVMGLLIMLSSFQNQDTLRLLEGETGWMVWVIELPSLVAMAVLSRRQPEAGRLVRVIWPWARSLALVTALLNVAYAAWFLWNSSYWLPWPELFLASCALIDLVVAYVLLTSPHLKQVFAEFPSRRAHPASSNPLPP